jgi:hypothetical protein
LETGDNSFNQYNVQHNDTMAENHAPNDHAHRLPEY